MRGPEAPTGRRRRCLVGAAVIGIALAAAPAAFGMFTRAPKGGRMIEDFRPYMSQQTIGRFRGYLSEIDAAKREVDRTEASGGASAVDEWRRQWPAINADMTSMLATMETNIGRFRGVSALPPFPLFPWFFVAPGVLIAALGVAALVGGGRSTQQRRLVAALAVVSVGLVAAPAVFQMFSRAPGGARMIDDFRPLMSTAKVTDVQRYFVVIGVGEAALRTAVLPGVGSNEGTLAATRTFSADWPRIGNQMAPMIGAMADNVGNFAAVDALPPFWLFPWFFVAPGLLVVALAVGAWPGSDRSALSRSDTSPVERFAERSTAS